MHPSKILSDLHITPQKKFSQNFLTSPHWAQKLAKQVLDSNYSEIWEIGGGLGAITKEIVKHTNCHIKVFEIDRTLSNFLQKTFPMIEVIEGDFLKFKFDMSQKDIGLISNLPYHISSKILFKLLEYKNCFSRLVLTFQKELAERLIAKPRTSSYSAISVIAQLNWKINIIGHIPPKAFYPEPEIESTALELINIKESQHKNLNTILKLAFSHRRKKLISNLRTYTTTNFHKKIENIFTELGINLNARAEDLSPSDYDKLIMYLSG